jgi:hypothetical protein
MIDVAAEQAIQHANELRRICSATEIFSDDVMRASVTVGLASPRQDQTLPEKQAGDRKMQFVSYSAILPPALRHLPFNVDAGRF